MCCMILNTATVMGCAGAAGIKATKAWSKALPASVVSAASPNLTCHDTPVTASQAVHVHLNKVAWWLDLQASQSVSQLQSITASDAAKLGIHAGVSQSEMDAGLGPEQALPGNRLTIDHGPPTCPPDLGTTSCAHLPSKPPIALAAPVANPGPDSNHAARRATQQSLSEQCHTQQQVRTLDKLPVVQEMLPSASTELFLQLEAATAYELKQVAQVSTNWQLPIVPEPTAAQLFQRDQLQQVGTEDPYAGLERGCGAPVASVSGMRPEAAAILSLQHHALATSTVITGTAKEQQGQLGNSPRPGPLGVAPQQGGVGVSPWLGPLGTAPVHCKSAAAQQQGQFGIGREERSQCKVLPRTPGLEPTPKAAEAPLVKQGSYAIAAKQARKRSERQQHVVQQLASQHAMRAASHSCAAQVRVT